MPKADWRNAKCYQNIQSMAQKDIAWEFLRRNSDYVAAFLETKKYCEEARSRLAGLWGLRDFADPSYTAQETPVFWRHDHCSSVIILSAYNLDFLGVGLGSLNKANIQFQRHSADGVDILVSHQHAVRQIFIPRAPRHHEQLCAIIPMDQMADRRLDATRDYFRGATGRKALTKKPPRNKNERMPSVLRALDGYLSGATYREIAYSFYDAARLETEPWRVSSVRDTTIRMVRSGLALMRKDYRKLLIV
jgi:hypothetical protein